MSVHEALDDAARDPRRVDRPAAPAVLRVHRVLAAWRSGRSATCSPTRTTSTSRSTRGRRRQIEQQAVRWVSEFVGFPATIGAFTSGGTISNVTALAAAREHAMPGARTDGPVGATPRDLLLRRGALLDHASGRAAGDRVEQPARPADRRLAQVAARRARRGDRSRPSAAGDHAGRGGRDRGHDPHRRDRPDRRDRRRLRRARRVAPRRRRVRAAGRRGPDARGLLRRPRSRRLVLASTRTSGSTCRRRAASSWCASADALAAAFAHEEGYLPHQQHELHAVDITLEYSRPFRALKLWLAFRAHGARAVPRGDRRRTSREADLLYRAARTRRGLRGDGRASAALDRARSVTRRRASPISTRTTTRSRRRSRPTAASTSHPR